MSLKSMAIGAKGFEVGPLIVIAVAIYMIYIKLT